jgi:hypothetical protein
VGNYSNSIPRNDGVSFVVNTPLVNGDVIYITDDEYNATTNVFGNANTGYGARNPNVGTGDNSK